MLGVDVGFSAISRSSAVCRLDWNGHAVSWTIQRFRAIPAERLGVLCAVAGDRRLEAAAFDGPLCPGFPVIGAYRLAERMLTRRLRPRIGKPGQSSAPVGKQLNAAANECAGIVRDHGDVAPARHAVPIDERAIVEAFPSSFMGVMLEDPSLVPSVRANRSDVFYQHLCEVGGFDRVLARLLPGRVPATPWSLVRNHDDRMALVCALTALAVAADDYVAVGCERQGWIILPPAELVRPWARRDLEENAADEATDCLLFSMAQADRSPP